MKQLCGTETSCFSQGGSEIYDIQCCLATGILQYIVYIIQGGVEVITFLKTGRLVSGAGCLPPTLS